MRVALDAYNEPMPAPPRPPQSAGEGGTGSEEMRPTPGVKLTYDDFLLFPDDGKRHELIDGEHYVTPSPNTAHQRIVGRLHLALGGYLERHPIGELFLAPFDVVFSQFDVVEPDLLYITAERRKEILTTQHVRGTPDLVIEVGSPGTRRRDETIKRRLYERAGVAEYWIIDPDLEVVRIYRRAGDSFAKPHELSREGGDVLASSLFPGFDLPLESVFRAV
jgi:Uma2 family endonuclease